MTATTNPSILVRNEGLVGRITLNRPETLNALTLEMVRLIDMALDRFESEDDIATVVIDGAGDRALCAGGDIRSIYEAAKVGDPSPRIFWSEEYHLNARIARYSKPIVAIMDGIVMGGGVGISAHASHRIVTDRSLIAMPEVGIGFAPDVGGTWLLSRAPGETGTHVALTAGRLQAADAIFCGLADHFVDTRDLSTMMTALREAGINDALEDIPSVASTAPLAASQPWIDRCYSANSVSEIIVRLQDDGKEGSRAAEDILSMSPTALTVTLRALREATDLSTLERCLEVEYRVSTAFLSTSDFIEGVRAAVIDKDRSPRWDPARLEEVGNVDRFFAHHASDLHIDTQELTQ
jgi:enoyl-CoA hydratase